MIQSLPPSETVPDDVQAIELLRARTGENCVPSREGIVSFQNADVVLMSGQFVGAGKSTLIHALEAEGRENIASWTNRDLRPGEVNGVDKVKATLADMAQKALEGYFMEMEEIREGVFYGTPSAFASGSAYIKDLELKGALRLRTFAPQVPIVVPLPPLRQAAPERVSEWERRVVTRESLNRSITDTALTDLRNRLAGVEEETGRIKALDLLEDPNTLFVVNDEFGVALASVQAFLATGEKTQPDGLEEHVQQLEQLAVDALKHQ